MNRDEGVLFLLGMILGAALSVILGALLAFNEPSNIAVLESALPCATHANQGFIMPKSNKLCICLNGKWRETNEAL